MYGWSVEGIWSAMLGLLLSSSGALRSLTSATFFRRVPLQMSDSRAPRPPLSSPLLSRRGLLLLLAWLRGGAGGGGGGMGMVLLLSLIYIPEPTRR